MQTATHQQREQTAQLVWTGFIVSFFLIQAIIWTVAILYTANDRSHVVSADYDQQSLHWDEAQAIKRASAALGWQLDFQIADEADVMGIRELRMELSDRDGVSIAVDSVDLIAFHRGTAADKQSIRLRQIEPGVYRAFLQIRKWGLWQFNGRVQVNGQRFLIDQQIDVRPASIIPTSHTPDSKD